MEEAAVKHTGYNLRTTAERSRRWAALSVPGEQTATALEPIHRRVSQHTRSRVLRPPRRQGRDGHSEEGIGREALPSRRANRRQNSQQRPDRNTVVTQTPITDPSLSSIHNGEVGNTDSQGMGADISHNGDTVSTARQEHNGMRHITNGRHGIESDSRSHVSERNDTRSRGSEESAAAAQGGGDGDPARNGVDANVTGQVPGRRRSRPRYGWAWTLADTNEPDSDSEWTSLYHYRNLVIAANLSRNYRRDIPALPEAVINNEQVHSGLKCSICLMDFELDQTVHKLPCDHIYHKDCIIPWLAYHNNCPMCRRPILDTGFHVHSQSRNLRSHIRLELVIRDGEVTIIEHH